MSYQASQLSQFIQVAQRQRAKDDLFVETIIPYLRGGELLEIGAGCGQLSELLQQRGVRVTASDLEEFFVEYHASRGLKTQVVDATNILGCISRRFDSVLAQGVSTLVTNDLAMVQATYRSVWECLEPSGRFLFIFPNAYGWLDKRWSKLADHWPIIARTGFTVVDHFRHQVLRSHWYGAMPPAAARLVENVVGRHFGLRDVVVLEKPSPRAA